MNNSDNTDYQANTVVLIESVEHWLKNIIIALGLCPFAKKPLLQNAIRIHISQAGSDEQKLAELENECQYLQQNPDTETTLLVYPDSLGDFFDFTFFVDWANQSLKRHNRLGQFQLAHFHPRYQFAGSETEDRENFTNRAPYPILHLLREESLAEAIEQHPDTAAIPERNIRVMESMTGDQLKSLFYFLRS